jgi:hypothetical protein
MTKRPLSVTVIGGLFIAAGLVGLVYHASEFKTESPFRAELVWICLVRLLAIVCGVFVLGGRNGARWGLLGWIAYHVILSAFHTLTEFVLHSLLFAVVTYFLFRPHVSAYFRNARSQPSAIPETNTFPRWLTAVLAVFFVAGLVGFGLRAWRRSGAEVYRTFASPDGRFQIVVYRIPTRGALPGQGSDASGYFQLREARTGRVLRERSVEMVQLVAGIEWSSTNVDVRLLADWELPR